MIRGKRRECAGVRGSRETEMPGGQTRDGERGNILISPPADLDRTGSQNGGETRGDKRRNELTTS